MTDNSNVTLYIKSEKIPVMRYSEGLHGHPCIATDRAPQTFYNNKPEDQNAMALLKEAGITHRIVDLSDCSFTVQLKAKIIKVNDTPTLVLNGRKIKGLENIKQALHEVRT